VLIIKKFVRCEFFNTSNGRIYVYGTVVSSKKAHFNSLSGLFPKNVVIYN